MKTKNWNIFNEVTGIRFTMEMSPINFLFKLLYLWMISLPQDRIITKQIFKGTFLLKNRKFLDIWLHFFTMHRFGQRWFMRKKIQPYPSYSDLVLFKVLIYLQTKIQQKSMASERLLNDHPNFSTGRIKLLGIFEQNLFS